jgi:hypothetical protein
MEVLSFSDTAALPLHFLADYKKISVNGVLWLKMHALLNNYESG